MLVTRNLIAGAAGFAMSLFAVSAGLGHLQASAEPAHQASAAASTPPLKAAPSGHQRWAVSNFPSNARGLTYGSDAAATSVKDAPDLVAVVGDKGVHGFVLKQDLYGPTISSPEQALDWEKKVQADSVPAINVYDRSGKTVVDTFTLLTGEVSYEEVQPDE